MTAILQQLGPLICPYHESLPDQEARASKRSDSVCQRQFLAHTSSEIPLPVPAEGQVLVDVYAAGLNFFEWACYEWY